MGPQQLAAIIQQAGALAIQALENRPDCDALFSGSPEDPDPVETLEGYLNGTSSFGSIEYKSYGSLNGAVLYAQVVPVPAMDAPPRLFPEQPPTSSTPSQVNIVFNLSNGATSGMMYPQYPTSSYPPSAAGTYSNPYIIYNYAATLLHELGHALTDITGSPNGITSPDGGRGVSKLNQDKVWQDCFNTVAKQ